MSSSPAPATGAGRSPSFRTPGGPKDVISTAFTGVSLVRRRIDGVDLRQRLARRLFLAVFARLARFAMVAMLAARRTVAARGARLLFGHAGRTVEQGLHRQL